MRRLGQAGMGFSTIIDAAFALIQNAAMLLGLVLFKAHHISWKKKQKQGFLQPKKNILIIIFSKFGLILDKIFKTS